MKRKNVIARVQKGSIAEEPGLEAGERSSASAAEEVIELRKM